MTWWTVAADDRVMAYSTVVIAAAIARWRSLATLLVLASGLNVALGCRTLDSHRATHSLHSAVVLDENAVSGRVNDAAMIHRDIRIDDFTSNDFNSAKRSLLVPAHVSAVADCIPLPRMAASRRCECIRCTAVLFFPRGLSQDQEPKASGLPASAESVLAVFGPLRSRSISSNSCKSIT